MSSTSKILTAPFTPRSALLTVLLTSAVVGAFAAPASAEKTVKLISIKCLTTETVFGPDKVYVLVNDDEQSIRYDSSQRLRVTKDLEAGETWMVNKTWRADDNAIIAIAAFDKDSGTQQLEAVLNALADVSRAVKKGGAKTKALASLAQALKSVIRDDDDELLAEIIDANFRGRRTVTASRGLFILGSNCKYEMTYEVLDR